MFESTFDKRCVNIAAPTALSFTSATTFSVLIFTNIPGNILIILALVFDPYKNLRTAFNWLLVNLGTADLIVGIIAQPVAVSFLIKEGLRKHGIPGEFVMSHITTFISCTASLLSLISLAVERYLAVRKPNTYRTKVTNKRIALTIFTIWVISLSLPFIYLRVGFTTYALIFVNTSIVAAVFIISITYISMRRQLTKTPVRNRNDRSLNTSSMQRAPIVMRNTHFLNATSQNAQSTSAEGINTDQFSSMDTNVNVTNAIATRRQLLQAKVTTMFVIVLIALLCCYGPSSIMMFLVNFCEGCSCRTLHWFRDLHFVFISMNSSINFFCYALRCSRFRKAFAKLLRINRRQSRESSYNLKSAQNASAQEQSNPAPRTSNWLSQCEGCRCINIFTELN